MQTEAEEDEVQGICHDKEGPDADSERNREAAVNHHCFGEPIERSGKEDKARGVRCSVTSSQDRTRSDDIKPRNEGDPGEGIQIRFR